MGRQEGEVSREVKGGRKERTGEGEGIKEREGTDTGRRGHSLVSPSTQGLQAFAWNGYTRQNLEVK